MQCWMLTSIGFWIRVLLLSDLYLGKEKYIKALVSCLDSLWNLFVRTGGIFNLSKKPKADLDLLFSSIVLHITYTD